MRLHPLLPFRAGLCAVLLVGAVASCQAPTAVSAAKGKIASKPASSAPADGAKAISGAALTGVVKAPAIAAGGGNVIAAGGANVIAAGGANFRLLGVAEVPLADTEVFLADANGNPIPGVASTRTDARGAFRFDAPPKGQPMLAVANVTQGGKPARLMTVVDEEGNSAEVSGASTLVTVGVLDERGAKLDTLDRASFRKAVSLAGDTLSEDKLPDFSSRDSVKTAYRWIEQQNAEIKALMDQLAPLLAEQERLKKEIEESMARIDEAAQRVKASPTPFAIPSISLGL